MERYGCQNIENPDVFQAKTLEALREVVISPDYDDLIDGFCRNEVYDRWSKDSSQPAIKSHNKIVGSLRWVLILHDFDIPAPARIAKIKKLERWSLESPHITHDYYPGLEQFRQPILLACEEAVTDLSALDKFAHSIKLLGFYPDQLEVGQLTKEIATGFWTHRGLGGYRGNCIEHPSLFQQKFREAFPPILEDPQYRYSLEFFRYTYEFKRSLYRIGDNIGMHERTGGLLVALQKALERGSYGYHKAPAGAIPLDDEFKAGLRIASWEVSKNLATLDKFASSLLKRKLFFVPIGTSEEEFKQIVEKENSDRLNNPEEATIPYLTKKIAASLEGYWQDYHVGNSWDPVP